jgi:hypothetical protein
MDASVKLHKDLVLRNRCAVDLGDKRVPKLAKARPDNSNYHLFCRVKGFLFTKVYITNPPTWCPPLPLKVFSTDRNKRLGRSDRLGILSTVKFR